jgi:6-phosphogluconolactonase (cycloisomerase 2 family)
MTMAVCIRRMLVGAASLLVLLAAGSASGANSIASVQLLIDNGSLGIRNGLGVAVSSPDGSFVYVAGAFDDDVAVFSRDSGTGKLTLVEKETDLGFAEAGPQALALSPGGGAHLYVASRVGVVTAFDRDSGTGLLTLIGTATGAGLGGADGIAVSPDGDHVYVAGENDDSVVIFSRDSGTGVLTYVTTVADANLDGPNGIVVSPDGLHVYVANRMSDSLAVYSRNAGTGLLTFVENQVDGVGGVDGLEAAVGVAISPNGLHVYVVGEGDDGIAVFSRNPGTGALTVVEFELGDERFLRRMSSVAVSDDGTHVFAAGRSRDAVVLLDRDNTTGELDYVAAEKLEDAYSVAVSPDGAHVYVGTRGDSQQFGVFRLADVACSAAPLLGCSTPFEAGKSLVAFKDKSPDDGDLFVWKWNRGPVTPLAAFGDPVNTTNDLIVCAYQDVLGTPQLVFSARMYAGGACDGKACWQPKGTIGYEYKDHHRTPDGLLTAQLKSGAIAGLAQIKMKGKGSLLTMPALPLVTPVVVQLQRIGACWETTHTTPLVSDFFQFKSKDN